MLKKTLNYLKRLQARQSQEQQIIKKSPFSEPLSKHRYIVNIYDLQPRIMLDTFVAPNCSVIGQVTIGIETNIWYGAVIRGDINEVKIGSNCNIGENTVIHTAACLPNGLPAIVDIQNNVYIQPNCTLYSCTIDDECLVGHKSVILEGARLEKGAVIGPNSVVPPGRIIPSMQLWAGNPVEYVRDLTKEEMAAIQHSIKVQHTQAEDHKYEFSPYNSAYLQKKNSKFDTQIDYSDMTDINMTNEMFDKASTQNHI